MKKYLIVLSAAMLMSALPSFAQKFSISTNLLDYACLGTLNIDASYSVSRRWSLTAGARYNPFTFNEGDPSRQFQMRQQSYCVGARICHGIRCLAGGLPESFATRNIIMEGSSRVKQRRATDLVQEHMPDTRICFPVTSIWNSAWDSGREWLCIGSIPVRNVELQLLVAESISCCQTI